MGMSQSVETEQSAELAEVEEVEQVEFKLDLTDEELLAEFGVLNRAQASYSP